MASTSGCAFATPYDVPAQASIGRSFSESPNAIVSAAEIPCSAAKSASMAAFETPLAAISTRLWPPLWLAATRCRRAGSIRASRSSECQLGCRTSSFAAGSASSSSSSAINVSSGSRPAVQVARLLSVTVRSLDRELHLGNLRPGSPAPPPGRPPDRSTGSGSPCAERRRTEWRRWQQSRHRASPTRSARSCSQRGGRAVTITKTAPASWTASTAALVRGEIGPVARGSRFRQDRWRPGGVGGCFVDADTGPPYPGPTEELSYPSRDLRRNHLDIAFHAI